MVIYIFIAILLVSISAYVYINQPPKIYNVSGCDGQVKKLECPSGKVK